MSGITNAIISAITSNISKTGNILIDKYLIKPVNKISYNIYLAKNKKHVLSLSVYNVESEHDGYASIIKNYPDKLQKLLKQKSTGIYWLDDDVNTKWKSYSLIFMPSKNQKGLTKEQMAQLINNTDMKRIKNCKYFVEKDYDECINSSIDILHSKDKSKDIGVFYIRELMLTVDGNSMCHNIPGAIQIYTAEQHFKTLVDGRLVGHLYDGARKYVSEVCTTLQEIYRNKHITPDYIKFLIKLLSTGYYSADLSSSTIARTGLTYYEKFGYMSGTVIKETAKIPYDTIAKLDYVKCFTSLLDVIEFRLDLQNIKLKNILTATKKDAGSNSSSKTKKQSSTTKKQSSTTKKGTPAEQVPSQKNTNTPISVFPGLITYTPYLINKLWSALPKIRYLCHELRPDYKFKLDTVLDLYNLIDSRKHDLDFFCKGNKKYTYTQALLLYVLLYRITLSIYSDLVSDFQSDDKIRIKYNNGSHVKLLRIENTEANQFILEQHARLPAVKKEYLAELTLDPAAGKNTKLSCEMREKIRTRVDNILKRIALLE